MKAAAEEARMNLTVGEIGEILGSVSEGDPGFRLAPLTGIDIDSRRISPGSLFVAVAGEKHDGHDFVEKAFESGAVAAIVSNVQANRRGWQGNRYICVGDTVSALGTIAGMFRSKFDLKVVGITGSNGKTTVKNLVYEILSLQGPALKSEKNYNNFFGLPLSIFKLTDRHKSAVFELGMSAPGEISRLSKMASPNIALITNVGPAHIEFFQSMEGIADAKMEIVDGLRPNGALIFNGDDALLRTRIDRKISTISFGLRDNNDVYPRNLRFDSRQLPSFEIEGVVFRLMLPGVHNVYNALAALSVAEAMGINMRKAAEVLKKYNPSDMRGQVASKNGIAYIVDCYNANPVSMKFAIDTLANMECTGRRIAVLGDMLELGAGSADYHLEIGQYAREKKIDRLFCLGDFSSDLVRGFGNNAVRYDTKNELVEDLKRFVRPGDLVLFKASRGVALEDVVEKMLGSE